MSVNPSGSSITLQRSTPGAATTEQVLELAFPECDAAAPYADMGMVFGLFLVAGAAVFAIKEFIYKQVANQ